MGSGGSRVGRVGMVKERVWKGVLGGLERDDELAMTLM